MPRAVKDELATLLRGRVVRADRAYGGYAPSATFRVTTSGRRRLFLKGTYPLPAGSHVKWMLEPEERVYQECEPFMRPWAPRYHGSVRAESWHFIVLEDVGPDTMPPWTLAKTVASARSYAEFHRSTYGKALPAWLPRTAHHEFAGFWDTLANGDLCRTASLAGRRSAEAEEWLDVALPVLRERSALLLEIRPPFAFMHFDTRSDNVRLQGRRLRLFDWNFAAVGPHEFEVAAFAQAIAMEGGPEPERVVAEYERILPLRAVALDASIAAIAGYFADRAWRPAQVGLPRIRQVQRRQLKATLAWAARRFGLPEPHWLDAIRI